MGFLSSFFLAPLTDESLPARAATPLFAAVFSLGGAVFGRFLADRLMRSSRYARSLSESCGKEHKS